jgi:molecular chaperone DnaJ
MTTKKDYYEILGVSRSADQKEIKAAYRRLARKYHPDVNKGEKNAEERFKEVGEAFAVLSDKDKRARYDRGGHEAFGAGFDPFAGFDASQFDFGFGNLSDIFEMFTGRRHGRAPGGGRSRRGADLRFETRISFLDAVRGTTLELKIPRRAPCGDCGGSGVVSGSGEATCPDCGGSGQRRQRHGAVQMMIACPRCGGAGRLRGTPCSRCDGEGRARREERVKARIPAGVENGSTVRLPGRGDAGAAGGPSGDLYLVLRVEEHPLFRREGRDLFCDVPVGLASAALGGTIEVPTLDGTAKITLPAGTKSGQKFRLKGMGLAAGGGKPAGDLFAVVQIHPPESLDARSRELMEEFRRRNPEPA